MQDIIRNLATILICLMISVISTTVSRAQSVEAQADAPSGEGEPARVAPRPLKHAMRALRAGRWDRAARIAQRDGPAAARFVEWARLQDGLGTPDDVLEFLEQHPDWPGAATLRARSE
ncbi:MAG: hypothetical protein AAF484_09025, partial [Pseudomonadota bacterium]